MSVSHALTSTLCMYDRREKYLASGKLEVLINGRTRELANTERRTATSDQSVNIRVKTIFHKKKMPALNGMAPSSLDQLMKSLINAPKSVFQSIDQGLLEQVRTSL